MTPFEKWAVESKNAMQFDDGSIIFYEGPGAQQVALEAWNYVLEHAIEGAMQQGFDAGKFFGEISVNPSDKQEADVLFNACMVREIDPSGTPKEVLDRIIDWEVAVNREAIESEPVAWINAESNYCTSDPIAAKHVDGLTPVYAAPPAQSAEQDRIDAERWRAIKYMWNFIDTEVVDAWIAKGASK